MSVNKSVCHNFGIQTEFLEKEKRKKGPMDTKLGKGVTVEPVSKVCLAQFRNSNKVSRKKKKKKDQWTLAL